MAEEAQGEEARHREEEAALREQARERVDVPPEIGERAALQETARSLGRWQGRMEGEIAESKHRLDKINGSLASVAENLSGVLVEVALYRKSEQADTDRNAKRSAQATGAVVTIVVGVVIFGIERLIAGG